MKLHELFPTAEERRIRDLPLIDTLLIPDEEGGFEVLHEGAWVSGRFPANIRIDQPTHGVGQEHAHVYGRKGDELVVVNKSGTASHKTFGRLHKTDAEALKARGFDIRDDRVVEWQIVAGMSWQMLLG